MQTLIAVRLRHGEPVAQTLGIGLVHIRHNRIRLPALHLLLILRTVDDDTDGEEVVDALKTALLFLHLLPDRVYRLRAALDMALDACRLHLLLHRTDERLDIGITRSLRLVQLLTDQVVGVVFHKLQREVFQFTLQLIESKLMGQGGIEIGGLLRHFVDECLTLLAVLVVRLFQEGLHLPHQVHTVGNHDEHHAHILGKGEQQITEVLTLDDGILLIELTDAPQAIDDASHGLSIARLHLVVGDLSLVHIGHKQTGLHSVVTQTDFLSQDGSRLSSHFLLFVVGK